MIVSVILLGFVGWLSGEVCASCLRSLFMLVVFLVLVVLIEIVLMCMFCGLYLVVYVWVSEMIVVFDVL